MERLGKWNEYIQRDTEEEKDWTYQDKVLPTNRILFHLGAFIQNKNFTEYPPYQIMMHY